MKAKQVYALVDPRDETVHYIGAGDAVTRHRVHISNARRSASTGVCGWIQGLLAEGLEPNVRVLQDELTDPRLIREEEQRWISHGLSANWPLTNRYASGFSASGEQTHGTSVYALLDPRNGSPYYVGAGHAHARYTWHLTDSRNLSSPCQRQTAEILEAGLRPELVELEADLHGPELWASEVAWIRQLREEGAPLTNRTIGGRGNVGHVWTDEMRFRHRKPKPQGFGELISRARKGVPLSQAHRDALRNGRRVQCADCTLRTLPGPMARHLKASGHRAL